MKYLHLLKNIDEAISKNNKDLAEHLNLGVPFEALQKILCQIPGDTDVLRDLYSWHNGTRIFKNSDNHINKKSLSCISLIPEEVFTYMDIEFALNTFLLWSDIAQYNSMIKIAIGRYFPILWDHSDAFICIDLKHGNNHKVIYYDPQNDTPFSELYQSFDEFLSSLLNRYNNINNAISSSSTSANLPVTYIDTFSKLDSIISRCNPQLSKQLKPGLSNKQINRYIKELSGDIGPLFELYRWHNGTEPLRWQEGDTYKFSFLKLSIVPNQLLIFDDITCATNTFRAWNQYAAIHPKISEAIERYFPILSNKSLLWLCLDLQPNCNHRIVAIELNNEPLIKEVFPSFKDLLLNILYLNENACE